MRAFIRRQPHARKDSSAAGCALGPCLHPAGHRMGWDGTDLLPHCAQRGLTAACCPGASRLRGQALSCCTHRQQQAPLRDLQLASICTEDPPCRFPRTLLTNAVTWVCFFNTPTLSPLCFAQEMHGGIA